MPQILFWTVVLVASLAALIRASDHFTSSAERIGLLLGVSPFIVGVTIVALGTSLPELITSLIAVAKDSSEIVAGNVVGSNIANIFLVFGFAAIVAKRMMITHDIIKVDLPFLVGSAFLLAIAVWDGSFSRFEALVCLASFIVYMLYSLRTEHKQRYPVPGTEPGEERPTDGPALWRAWAVVVISAAFIYLGANYTIEAIINLSVLLNVGKEVIAISAVALGTSLPELAVSITAARRGKPEIAVGNIIGSNIFNSLAVMGISALFGTLTIPAGITSFGLPVMLIATLLFVFITQGKETASWEGWLLLIFYVLFIGKLFKAA